MFKESFIEKQSLYSTFYTQLFILVNQFHTKKYIFAFDFVIKYIFLIANRNGLIIFLL